MAKEFALQGAQVVLSARRFEELEKVRISLLHPDQHISICADITDETQVRHAYEQVLEQKGRIDWLINNAGLSSAHSLPIPPCKLNVPLWKWTIFPQVFLTKTVLPTFIEQKSGHIAFVSSVAGLLGTQYRAILFCCQSRQFTCGPIAYAPKWRIKALGFR